MSKDSVNDGPSNGSGETFAGTVAGLAGTIGHKDFPSGDLAMLRRMAMEPFPPAAYWRLLFRRVPESQRQTQEQENNWALVMECMAVMAPNVHVPGKSLGRVLAEIGQATAENRLMQFLRSHGDRFEDQLRLLARYMAAQARAVDWVGLAHLVFVKDPEKLESIRRHLARDFYLAQTRKEKAA